MRFSIAREDDFKIIQKMISDAKILSYKNGIYQWDDNYPSIQMLKSDIKNGNTYLIIEKNKTEGFFTSNEVCEDNVHTHIKWKNTKYPWIFLHRLCIAPEFQGKKIAQKTISKFEHMAIINGYKSIRVDVFATNNVAIHIYTKFGFEKLGECFCERGKFYVFEKII